MLSDPFRHNESYFRSKIWILGVGWRLKLSVQNDHDN